MFSIEEIRFYCLAKIGVEESTPFREEVLVFKVGGKIFALLDIEKGETIGLKYHTAKIDDLRAEFSGVLPGYHMNKRHWNTVIIGDNLPKNIKDWIDVSYDLVFDKLSKKEKDNLLSGK